MLAATLGDERISVKSFVYIKVIEARDLCGVGSNSAAHYCVEASFKGDPSSRSPASGMVKPSANPIWHAESVLVNPPENAIVQLHVLEQRPTLAGGYAVQFHAPTPSTSSKKIGKADIALSALKTDELNDLWLPLDLGGGLHVFLQHVHPSARLLAQPPHFASTSPVLASPRFQFGFYCYRVQLERNKYFPGEVIRGALVCNLAITTKFPALYLEITGESASWVGEILTGEGVQRNWLSHRVWLSDPKAKLVLDPGTYLYPFEFQLPMEVAPSVELSQTCYTRYEFLALDAKPGKPRLTGPAAGFDICSPSARYPASQKSFLPPNFPTNASKSPNSLASLQAAPSIVWSDHKYTFTCRLHNTEKHPARALIVTLKKKVTLVTLGLEGDIRDAQAHESQSLSNEYLVDTHRVEASSNMFPIESGSTWEGTITVRMPNQLEPSIHCTESPLIQLSYVLCISLNCGSSESKQFEYPVVVCGRNWSPNGIVPPMKLVGTPLRFNCIKNADPALYHAAMVPNLRDDLIQRSGRPFPPLEPNPVEIPAEPMKPLRRVGSPWKTQWSSGTMPPWFAKGKFPKSPHDEFFSREAMFPGLTEYVPLEHRQESSRPPDPQPSSPPPQMTPAPQASPPPQLEMQQEPQESPSPRAPPESASSSQTSVSSPPAAPTSSSWRFAKPPSG